VHKALQNVLRTKDNKGYLIAISSPFHMHRYCTNHDNGHRLHASEVLGIGELSRNTKLEPELKRFKSVERRLQQNRVNCYWESDIFDGSFCGGNGKALNDSLSQGPVSDAIYSLCADAVE